MKTLLTILLLATVAIADVQIAPDGTMVAGTPTLTPNGTWVGSDNGSITMTPDSNFVGGESYTITPDGGYVGGQQYTITPNGRYVKGDGYYVAPDGSYIGNGK